MNPQRIEIWKLKALKKMKSKPFIFAFASLTYIVPFTVSLYQNPQKLRKTISNDIFSLSEFIIPQSLRHPIFTLYCKKYNVCMEDLVKPLRDYKSFSQFFTRKIKQRDISWKTISEQRKIVSPAQGTILNIQQVNNINESVIIKGITYSIGKLLYSNDFDTRKKKITIDDLKMFKDSKIYQIIVYLAPGNYHRFHSPLDFNVLKVRQIEGSLLPVNTKSLKKYGGKVYEENCRKIIEGEYKITNSSNKIKQNNTLVGKLYLSFVGAMNVSKIYLHKQNNTKAELGQQIGYFNLGSTIVMLVQAKNIDWACKQGQKLKYGDILGIIQQSVPQSSS